MLATVVDLTMLFLRNYRDLGILCVNAILPPFTLLCSRAFRKQLPSEQSTQDQQTQMYVRHKGNDCLLLDMIAKVLHVLSQIA